MNTIQKLTLRSLLMNKSRTAMTIVAIMLSCALITVVAGMGTSAWQSFINSKINSYGDYDVYFEGKFTDKNVNDLKINRDVDGIYYEYDAKKSYAGLIYQDGAYYYINDYAKPVAGKSYYISRTNDLTFADGTPIPKGTYTFDADGKMIIDQ